MHIKMTNESLDKPRYMVYNCCMKNQKAHVLAFSSESVEYYTPSEIIEAARSLMGGIDLDPASCVEAQETVRARTFYTQQDDGLKQQWEGRVWLNPPYGKIGNESSQGYWAERLIVEYDMGNVGAACLLTRSALGYEWYESLLDRLPVCLFRKRVEFVIPGGGTKGPSKQGVSVFYLGENRAGFVEHFGEFGRIIFPEDYKGGKDVWQANLW